MTLIERLAYDAAPHGLAVRAAFAIEPGDGIPALDGGAPAQTLMLFGNVGSSLWPGFSAGPEYTDGKPDALDRWSERIGGDMARRYGGRAFYPFGPPPRYPFQRWALRGESLFASPVGLLVDTRHGLWHAFRFALALPDALDEPPVASTADSPCASCAGRPCLSACPAQAFVEGEYRVRRCVEFLADYPDAACWRIGCLPRHACPIGQSDRYLPAQAAFHMRAFFSSLSAQLELPTETSRSSSSS
jgi:hypothetical protein